MSADIIRFVCSGVELVFWFNRKVLAASRVLRDRRFVPFSLWTYFGVRGYVLHISLNQMEAFYVAFPCFYYDVHPLLVGLIQTNFIISADILCTRFFVYNTPSVFLYMPYWCSVTLWRLSKHVGVMAKCVLKYNFNIRAFVGFIVWIV